MHKYAEDCKPGDVFSLGGCHYRVINVYNTVDDEIVKVSFVSRNRDDPQTTSIICTHRKTIIFTV